MGKELLYDILFFVVFFFNLMSNFMQVHVITMVWKVVEVHKAWLMLETF